MDGCTRVAVAGGLAWGRGLAKLILLLAVASGATAQPCQPLDCVHLTVAQPPGFEYPDAADFVPDRRPVLGVVGWGGPCTNPPAGGPSWWTSELDLNGNGVLDSVEELLRKFSAAYASGFRRIVMVKPGGSMGGQIVASGQWWTMSPARRASLEFAIPQWLHAHPNATLGVYVGFPVADPCSLCMAGCERCVDCGKGEGCGTCPECAGAPEAHLPDTTNFQDMCVVMNNVRPWMDLGFKELWFDYSGGNEPVRWLSMLNLAGNPDYEGGIRFGSEPIVHSGPGGGMDTPNNWAAERLTYVSSRRYYEIVGRHAPAGTWDFDPARTEVIVMFRERDFCIDQDPDDGDACTKCPDFCEGQPDYVPIDVVYDYVKRGYVPWARSEKSVEYVRRILDLVPETLPCPSDLDADDDVDMVDVTRLVVNLGMLSGATLYHGDLDFDGDVDAIDYVNIISDPLLGNGTCADEADAGMIAEVTGGATAF